MGESNSNPSPGPGHAPGLGESAKRIGDSGKASLDSALATGRALRHLVSADFALAQAAIIRIVIWAVVAGLFASATWLLTITGAILALHALGLSLLVSSLIGILISLLLTGFAIWRVSVFVKDASMRRTRQQLRRFGLFLPDEDESTGQAPEPGARSA